MPCPAALSVLLICLQLKKTGLGFTLVGCFSLGLSITMVSTGVLTALSLRHAKKKFKGVGEAMRKTPFISFARLVLVGVYMLWLSGSALRYPSHAD